MINEELDRTALQICETAVAALNAGRNWQDVIDTILFRDSTFLRVFRELAANMTDPSGVVPEDLAEEACATLCKRLPSNPTTVDLKDRSAHYTLNAYIQKAGKHALIDALRKHKRQEKPMTSQELTRQDYVDQRLTDPAEIAATEELRGLIQYTVRAQLCEECRKVLLLKFVEGRTLLQIGIECDISGDTDTKKINNTDYMIKRCLSKLRELLKQPSSDHQPLNCESLQASKNKSRERDQ